MVGLGDKKLKLDSLAHTTSSFKLLPAIRDNKVPLSSRQQSDTKMSSQKISQPEPKSGFRGNYTVRGMHKSKWLQEQENKAYLEKFRPKGMITIKGQTYSKPDVLHFKKYFDKLNENKTGQLSLDEFVRNISTTNHLRRIAVSLYQYLDEN